MRNRSRDQHSDHMLNAIHGEAITAKTGDKEILTIDFTGVSQVETGKPVSVMLTCYSTTLIANGADQTRVWVALVDSINREITGANDSLRIYVTGDGEVTNPDGSMLPIASTQRWH